ncbi:hypothetical protein L596_018899 [Steinernema carpocapsae]|uniref:DUF4200 domain-containing protein n=1 Tax=Steinernema carpocapsae TaxID=34508 RepID=A0A4V6A272_STECR|nr:hypothetical protein L596_018899 [Steinernema carpocapsae]
MADGRISAATASNDSRKPELDEETRRTIGLIRHYKERLALETARFEKAADLTEKLQEEGRVLHEHNAVLEGKCEEMKEYTNFVGEKRRRFREAYCGIVDQEDFEIRDTNRMLRDFIVVNREITEILKLTQRRKGTRLSKLLEKKKSSVIQFERCWWSKGR